MADTTSRVSVVIAGSIIGVLESARLARAAIRSVRDAADRNRAAFNDFGDAADKATGAVKRMLGGLTKIGAIGNLVPVVAGLATSFANLAPAALLAVGAFAAFQAAKTTFSIATAGFADAVGGDAEAMASLAPAAQEAARGIQALNDGPIRELRQSVQQAFFTGFNEDVQRLAAHFLPTLRRSMTGVAEAFARVRQQTTAKLIDEGALEDVAEIFGNTREIIDGIGGALGDFALGLLRVANIASDFLPGLTDGLDELAAKFRAFVEDNPDKIRAAIEGALDGFRQLGEIAGNVGTIIGNVFEGLTTGSGKDFFQLLIDITGQLAEFTGKAETQEALAALGKAFTDVGTALREVLFTALEELGPIIVELAPVISEIARVVGEALVNALQIAGPLLRDFAAFLRDNKEVIAEVAPLVLGLWAAFKGYAIVRTAALALAPLVARLGGLARVLKVGGLVVGLALVAEKVNEINKAAAASEGRELNDMEDSLDDIVGAGHEIAELNFDGILADIGDELGQVRQGFLDGTSPIGAFKDKFLEINGAIADFAVGVRDKVVGFFTADLPNAVQGVSDSVLGFFNELPTKAGDGLSSLADTVGTFFTETLPNTISSGLETAFTAVTDFFVNLPERVGFALGVVIGHVINFVTNTVNMFLELPGKIGEAISGFSDTVSTEATEAGSSFLDTVKEWFDNAVNFLAELPGKIGRAIADFVTVARDTAVEAGTNFYNETKRLLDEAVAFVSTVPGKVGSAISSLVGVLAEKAIEAGNSFRQWIVFHFEQAVAFIRSIPARIQAAIGYLGNLLYNAGKDLIDGLGRGIRAAYNSLLDFVGGIADGIASVKGPLEYDRRVLRPAGEALMEGLGIGIRTGFADVQRLTGTLAPQLAAGGIGEFDMLLSARADAQSGSGLANLLRAFAAELESRPLVVNVDLDGEPVRSAVRTGIAAADRESARTLRVGSGVTW